MTEVVESVRRLLQKTRSRLIEGGEVEVEGFDKSFHSTNTRFVGSPSMSIMSAWAMKQVEYYRSNLTP